ncbi:MAG: hypothetical protein VR78_10560 [Hoeflea sp. BRH_c9]|nr:MAG: hypothetical protein VR78_10560 [Hoeflea sp. BRH_c9]
MITFPGFHETIFETDDQRAAAAAQKPEVRQAMVENLLVRYPRFQEAYKKVSLLHRVDAEQTPIVGRISGFIGNSRAGKTWIVRALMEEEGNKSYTDAGGNFFPMAYILMAEKWSATDLAVELFLATGASAVPAIGTKGLEQRCQRRIGNHRTKLVIIDEAQFNFQAPPSRQRTVLSLLKKLVDSKLCSILLVGLDTIEGAIMNDDLLFRRGFFPKAEIREHDVNSEFEDYQRFLLGVSERLPFLEDSFLYDDPIAREFSHITNGSVGHTMEILIDAGRFAISDRSPRVMRKHLHQACFNRKRVGDPYIPFSGADY